MHISPRSWASRLVGWLSGPRGLAFLPAITLGCYWTGGEPALVGAALGVPVLLALFAESPEVVHTSEQVDGLTGLTLRRTLQDRLDNTMTAAPQTGRSTACISLEIDDFTDLSARLGRAAAEDVLIQTATRLRSATRNDDTVARLDGAGFAIGLAPVRRVDLESLIQMSGRLQAAVADPIAIDGATIYVSASIGFCLASRAPAATGNAILEASIAALNQARSNGPGAIRSYSSEMCQQAQTRHAMAKDIGIALENDQIRPWFQPQLSTDTGKVTGMEALARWHHPDRGIIAPAEFLPAINDAGLSERLSEVMLYGALTALKSWDNDRLNVPTVGVNFSSHELRNPKLVDKIRWELDRFNLAPERLCVEILETVVADPNDDTITRNLNGLAALGCKLDLDDFGTGHASIASIRRFRVGRIKIDRSFIAHVDDDADQQRMVAAILTMAERLGLETLAEGIETIGEHAMLAQLGCDHVQGFGLARPMPTEDIPAWLHKHKSKLGAAPVIGRKTG